MRAEIQGGRTEDTELLHGDGGSMRGVAAGVDGKDAGPVGESSRIRGGVATGGAASNRRGTGGGGGEREDRDRMSRAQTSAERR